MVAQRVSIEDEGIGLSIQNQLNGALEAGRWHNTHLPVFRQLHAIGAFHHGDPTAAELLWAVDGCFGGSREKQGEG